MVVYQWSTEGLSTQPRPKVNHNRSRIDKVDKSVCFSENKSKKIPVPNNFKIHQ